MALIHRGDTRQDGRKVMAPWVLQEAEFPEFLTLAACASIN
jgi:hypothetical protein